MEVSFENEELAYFYQTPLEAIRGKTKYPKIIIKQYKKAVQLLLAINRLEVLTQFKGLRFKYLKGDKFKVCSIRLNDQYRLIFQPIKTIKRLKYY